MGYNKESGWQEGLHEILDEGYAFEIKTSGNSISITVIGSYDGNDWYDQITIKDNTISALIEALTERVKSFNMEKTIAELLSPTTDRAEAEEYAEAIFKALKYLSEKVALLPQNEKIKSNLKLTLKTEIDWDVAEKLGITFENAREKIPSLLRECAENREYRFTVRCIEDVVVEDDELWLAGNEYIVKTKDFASFLANSENNDFEGTYMSEEDLVNYFNIIEASSQDIIDKLTEIGCKLNELEPPTIIRMS